MSVQPDRWIKEMAEKGMIAPFESQVSKTEEGKIASYGTSSAAMMFDVQMNLKFSLTFTLLLLTQNHLIQKVLSM